MLSAKAGIVIFVGMAARLVTSAMPMATIPVINNGKFGPAKKVAITVIGVRMHPCAARITPNQRRRFFSWPLQ